MNNKKKWIFNVKIYPILIFAADEYYYISMQIESYVDYEIRMFTIPNNIYFEVNGVNQLDNFVEGTNNRSAYNLYLMRINSGNGLFGFG